MAEVAQRERVLDDLKGLVKGGVLFDEISRTLYSTDASIFEVEPLGVVTPRDEADLQALIQYAAANQVALVPRGAGTGQAGESLGPGLIVDFSRHFRTILEISGSYVRVQPGVTWGNLQRALTKLGRRLAIEGREQGTIGGMVARNACGVRVLRHGYIREHVLGLRVMLDSGDASWVGRESRWPPAGSRPGRKEDIVTSVATLLEQRAQMIRDGSTRTSFNRCGYNLDVLREDTVDLHRLLVGSEGTLGLFTEVTLGTIPLPADRSLVLLGFESLERALRALPQVLPTQPSACELLDQRLVTLGRGADAQMAAFIPTRVEALLVVEYESEAPKRAQQAAAELARLQRIDRLAPFFHLAADLADVERLGQVRERALPSLFGLRGGRQPIPLVEDLAVPVAELAGFVRDLQAVLRTHDTAASFLIHAGSGQVELYPFVDLRRPEDVACLRPLTEDVFELTLALGGTISTQHGTGLARTQWVEKQFGRVTGVFRDLKAIFDPRRIFNPGKIVGQDVAVPAWPLRYQRARRTLSATAEAAGSSDMPGPVRPDAGVVGTSEPPARAAAPLQLLWNNGSFAEECMECNGCGSCRTEAPVERMCPIFRSTPDEAATPRAKANILRRLLEASSEAPPLSSDEVRTVANLCVNCKMCRQECPAHVNIPKLMLEAKAANVTEHGMRISDWVLARTESFARIGSSFAPLINPALDNVAIRWCMEKFLGVSRHRRLPAFARRNFVREARRRGWTHPVRSGRPRVAYFVDIFANYNDSSIAEATVAVLHHQGIEVHVPSGQVGCGMAALANGDVESAREALERNLRVLAEPAREGYAIVCSEPTAAIMLAQDSLDLVDSPDARLVAGRVVEFTAFLEDLHAQGRLRTDFRRLELSVGHHIPCHIKALGRPAAGPHLLSLIPGIRVQTLDTSCSGMAGTFGLKADNYEMSLESGRPMLERFARPGLLFGSTECSSCRVQMEGAVGKRTLHPAQYLALAYGLMPELLHRLQRPIGERVLG